MAKRDRTAIRAFAADAVARLDALPLIGSERYGLRPQHDPAALAALVADLRTSLRRVAGTTSHWPAIRPLVIGVESCITPRRGKPIRHVRVFDRVARLRNAFAALAAGRALSPEGDDDE